MHQTLGEQKVGTCAICNRTFLKSRFDHKFCSTKCRVEAKHFYKNSRWFDRPDRETQNDARKERYYKNRQEILAAQKAWRVANPEEAKEKDHKKYERNKEKHAQRVKAYRESHPELGHKYYKNAQRKRPWLPALTNAKHRASKKGFAFDLTREWCEQKWTGKCAVTNLPFLFGTQKHFPFSPSIDRINSALGYLQANCRFVLFSINSFKGIGTDEDMITVAKAIVANLS